MRRALTALHPSHRRSPDERVEPAFLRDQGDTDVQQAIPAFDVLTECERPADQDVVDAPDVVEPEIVDDRAIGRANGAHPELGVVGHPAADLVVAIAGTAWLRRVG